MRPRGGRHPPGRARRLAPAIARELGVAPDAVHLAFDDPPMLDGRGLPPGRQRRNRVEGPGATLFGDFTAALRRPDGRWIAVQPVQSGMAAWRLRLLFWLVVAVATVAPFAWLLARRVTHPVAAFADAAERIGRDPRTTPLALRGPREIVHAARALNEMQERLNRYVDDRTVMIGAIAHDLRTPLMRMALRLERAPPDLRDGVQRDMADMQAMISAATDYVRDATRSGARRRLDLRSLAEAAVDDQTDRGGRAVLEVRDHGPGVDPAELERLFEPFYRAERSRNRETGGTGLGLASVRGVVRQHGGDAVIRNHPDGGLLVRVELPL